MISCDSTSSANVLDAARRPNVAWLQQALAHGRQWRRGGCKGEHVRAQEGLDNLARGKREAQRGRAGEKRGDGCEDVKSHVTRAERRRKPFSRSRCPRGCSLSQNIRRDDVIRG